MTTPEHEGAGHRDPGFKVVYWVIIAVLLVLAVIGVASYSSEKESERASQKADELTQKYVAAGLTAPHKDIIVRTLGDDGGNVCDDPADAIGIALINDQLTNGGSHVGRRPVIADVVSLQGQALIIETYCPDELEKFQEKLDDYKTDDTIKE